MLGTVAYIVNSMDRASRASWRHGSGGLTALWSKNIVSCGSSLKQRLCSGEDLQGGSSALRVLK